MRPADQLFPLSTPDGSEDLQKLFRRAGIGLWVRAQRHSRLCLAEPRFWKWWAHRNDSWRQVRVCRRLSRGWSLWRVSRPTIVCLYDLAGYAGARVAWRPGAGERITSTTAAPVLTPAPGHARLRREDHRMSRECAAGGHRALRNTAFGRRHLDIAESLHVQLTNRLAPSTGMIPNPNFTAWPAEGPLRRKEHLP